jgi:hypothetical protein
MTHLIDEQCYIAAWLYSLIKQKMATTTEEGPHHWPLCPYNLKHDPHHTLDGILVLRCHFCKRFQTPIEYDMRVHLRDIHQKDLVIRIPEGWLERGKRYNLDERTKIMIGHMKHETYRKDIGRRGHWILILKRNVLALPMRVASWRRRTVDKCAHVNIVAVVERHQMLGPSPSVADKLGAPYQRLDSNCTPLDVMDVRGDGVEDYGIEHGGCECLVGQRNHY